jgi:four helix bundle protein
MQNETPIIQKVYDFYRELYLTVEKMPKKDKYTIGQRLSNTTLDLLEILIAASNTKPEKSAFLNNASVKLDFLKIIIRLAEEIRALDQKKYLKLEGNLQEIGKMLGGWIRSTRVSG